MQIIPSTRKTVTRLAFYLTLFCLYTTPVYAGGTITVTTFDDEYDSTANTTCSLREAIESANTAQDFGGCSGYSSGGSTTIELASGTYALTLGSTDDDNNADGDLDLAADITIKGSGPENTIITSDGKYTIFNIISDTVKIKNLTITKGTCGIENLGTAVVQDCVISYNDCGISTENSDTTIIDTSINNNTEGISTGSTDPGNSSISTKIYSSSIINNKAVGITNVNATIYIYTSTISGNSGSPGGAITQEGFTFIYSSTITNNEGGIWDNNAGVTLYASILAGNTGEDCNDGMNGYSGGYNLFTQDGNCLNAISIQDTDRVIDSSSALGLLSLADNGGATQTIAISKSSPALDAIPSGTDLCQKGSTDQRGVSRPQGTGCDIGAFERKNSDILFYLPAILH